MRTRKEENESTVKEERRKRVPLGVQRSKMTATNIPNGYVPRWVNDDPPGRIKAAMESGYTMVNAQGVFIGEDIADGNTDLGSAVSIVVGRDSGGQPVKAYLMCIKQEWYDEDQAKKLEAVKDIENQIKTGQVSRTADDGRYIPKAGIQIQEGSGVYKP
jgi:hypothetical protein